MGQSRERPGGGGPALHHVAHDVVLAELGVLDWPWDCERRHLPRPHQATADRAGTPALQPPFHWSNPTHLDARGVHFFGLHIRGLVGVTLISAPRTEMGDF